MSRFSLLLVALFVLGCVSSVVVLDSTRLNQDLLENKILVKFYAPWCGHCKKLIPVWDEVSAQLAGDVIVGKVDCDQELNNEVCSKYGVTSYPTIALLHRSKFEYYSGDRTVESFVNFGRTSPSREVSSIQPTIVGKSKAPTYASVPKFTSSLIETVKASDFASTFSKGTWVILLTVGSAFDTDFKPIFEFAGREARKTYSGIRLAEVNVYDSAIGEQYGIKGFPATIFVHEGEAVLYEGNNYDWKPLLTFLESELRQNRLGSSSATTSETSFFGYQVSGIKAADCIHGLTFEVCAQEYPLATVIFIFSLGMIFGALLRNQHRTAPKGN